MRLRYLAILAVAFLVFAIPGVSLGFTYFDATNSLIDLTKPAGTQWHQLYPDFCTGPYTIIGWKDNGDGVLSHCDTLAMQNPDGSTSCHHVVDVTITLELALMPPPSDPQFWDWDHSRGGEPLSDPVCTWWIEIYPDFGLEHHIVAWEDNGSGVLDFCDGIVVEGGAQYHVEGVHHDMVTEPADQCATDLSTWGRIKLLFR